MFETWATSYILANMAYAALAIQQPLSGFADEFRFQGICIDFARAKRWKLAYMVQGYADHLTWDQEKRLSRSSAVFWAVERNFGNIHTVPVQRSIIFCICTPESNTHWRMIKMAVRIHWGSCRAPVRTCQRRNHASCILQKCAERVTVTEKGRSGYTEKHRRARIRTCGGGNHTSYGCQILRGQNCKLIKSWHFREFSWQVKRHGLAISRQRNSMSWEGATTQDLMRFSSLQNFVEML